MKKLGKKFIETKDTLEAYCYCLCEPSGCWSRYATTSMTATLGSNNQAAAVD